MIIFKVFVIFLFVTVLIGCGGKGEQPGTEVELTESAVVDSIVSDLDKTSEELQSITDEVQKALDELLEEEN